MGILQAEMAGKRNASMKIWNSPFLTAKAREKWLPAFIMLFPAKTDFVQAPTGVGKTMSSVFPSVRAIGEGKGAMSFS